MATHPPRPAPSGYLPLMDARQQAALEGLFSRHDLPNDARDAILALLGRPPLPPDDRLALTADLARLQATTGEIPDNRLALTADLADAFDGPGHDAPRHRPAPNPPAPPFEDLGRIGLGGMGEVRRVRETALGRVVAMKILREGADAGWFEREARLTASLDHPGVLPLFSFGRLPDGRPWFTLREAQGETLREALDEPPGRGLRRLLEALRRVAETVAAAHARGILHRDLKPENILLGAFGAVWVLDWGIATAIGEVPGSVVGSPRYMAPEQLRKEPLGTATDVWALGALLYEILSGRPAFPGDANAAMAAVRSGPPAPLVPPVDPGLSAIVVRAMASHPSDRHPDAAAFAEALGAWLDGAAARAEALQILSRAQALFAGSQRRRIEAGEAREEAARRLSNIPTWAPAEEKQAAWMLEDRGREALLAVTIEEEQATELARQALQRCPDLREAHQVLAAYYRARLEEAERTGDPASTRLEERLRAHDTGEQTRWLLGNGALTLLSAPTGATVHASRLVEAGRRMVLGPWEPLGVTPLLEVPLGRGSWLLRLSAEGHRTVLYPVKIDRSASWDGVPPLRDNPLPICLPSEADLSPEEVYVPAGWCSLGGDPKAINPRPSGRVWVDAFVVRRFATTHGEYLSYVNQLQAEEGLEVARAAVPVGRHADKGLLAELVYELRDRRWEADLRTADGVAWQPDWPVMLVSHGQATRYAQWLGRQTGRPWRLLRDEEFEKAARGVDGRYYPWGDGFDHSFSCIRGSYPDGAHPGPVGDFPLDESVYGVRGLAGGCRTWVDPVDEKGACWTRGSYWNAAGVTSRSASRFPGFVIDQSIVVGIRLARSP